MLEDYFYMQSLYLEKKCYRNSQSAKNFQVGGYSTGIFSFDLPA